MSRVATASWSTVESSARRRPTAHCPSSHPRPRSTRPDPKANPGTPTDTHDRVCTDRVDEAGSVTLRVKHGVRAAVDVALLGRCYERVADHAVEVGRRAVFMLAGALPPRMTSAPTERRTPGRPPSTWRSRSLRRPKRRTARDLPTRWTQGGWISGRGGCYTVQPRRQHRPPAYVYPAGLVPRLRPRVLGRGDPAPGPATGPVGVGESCWGMGRRPRAFPWLAQTRRQARLDGTSLPQQGVSATFVPDFR